jgi:hypothetical protein
VTVTDAAVGSISRSLPDTMHALLGEHATVTRTAAPEVSSGGRTSLTPTCSTGADQPPRAEAAFTVRGVGRVKRRPGDAGTCRGDVLARGVARGVDCGVAGVAGVVAVGRGDVDVAAGAGGVCEVDGAAVAVRVADGVAVGVARSGRGVNAGGIVDDVEANVGVGLPVG